MLVLSRKAGQQIVIDGQIVVRVKRISGDRVVLGIEAPKSVPVLRAELRSDPPGRDADSPVPAETGEAVFQ